MLRAFDTTQDSIGLCGIGYIPKGFTAKAMGDFSKCNPFPVSESQRHLELGFEDPVFGSKILITQKEFLVHCPSGIGQYACLIHNYPHVRLH